MSLWALIHRGNRRILLSPSLENLSKDKLRIWENPLLNNPNLRKSHKFRKSSPPTANSLGKSRQTKLIASKTQVEKIRRKSSKKLWKSHQNQSKFRKSSPKQKCLRKSRPNKTSKQVEKIPSKPNLFCFQFLCLERVFSSVCEHWKFLLAVGVLRGAEKNKDFSNETVYKGCLAFEMFSQRAVVKWVAARHWISDETCLVGTVCGSTQTVELTTRLKDTNCTTYSGFLAERRQISEECYKS